MKAGGEKMRQDYASIIKFIMNVSEKHKATAYIENVKESLKLPAVYFQLPETTVHKVLISSGYRYDNLAFIQIFNLDDDSAYNLSFEIANAIMEKDGYIPIINEDGKESGSYLHISVKNLTRIENCHSQLQLFWQTVTQYIQTNVKVQKLNIFINMKGSD